MEQIKGFLNKNKTEILLVLGAIITICASFAGLNKESAIVASIVTAVVTCLIEIVKNGFTDTAATLLAKSIILIINSINTQPEEKKEAVSASEEESSPELSVDEVKKILINGWE